MVMIRRRKGCFLGLARWIADLSAYWWGYLDLNQGPISYEPTALTTELYPRQKKDKLLNTAHAYVVHAVHYNRW